MARRTALSALFALAAFGAHAADVAQTAVRVVEGTNAFRNSQGLSPVQPNAQLEKAAVEFARYMAKTGKYGHSADGRQPSERASDAGYDYCIVTENLASQYRSSGYGSAKALAEALLEGWKRSPEHRDSMLDPSVTQTGVGIAQGEQGRYFGVQMFGRPKSAAIRISVLNRSQKRIEYRAGERSFALPPRVESAHVFCRPTELRIPVPGKSEPFTAQAVDRATYTVFPDRVGSEQKP